MERAIPNDKSQGTLPIVVIVGETASGKSSLAYDIAKQFKGENISADSWNVYREFNIGTAKPSQIEQKAIKHHLIDVVNAPDGFNAALFKQRANKAIDEIHSKGKLPILVGGTGLYIDSVLFDYEFLPPADQGERTRRNDMSIDELVLEAGIRDIDLSNIDIRNKRRIIRALESNGLEPSRSAMRANTLVVGLVTQRETLRQRITERVDAMIFDGLEAEVSLLSQKYGWEVEPMKGIGYREWRDYFLGSQNLPQTRERIISSTMNLAKRQRTWFKRNSGIQWIENRDKIVGILTTFLNKNP